MQAKLRVTTKTQSFCGEVPPLLRTAEHISCCLPALLESRAKFSAKWLQKVPKPCDFWFGYLVLLKNEGACIVNDLAHLDVNHVPYYGN